MNNPEGIDFSAREESNFLAELLIAILKMYEGHPLGCTVNVFSLGKCPKSGVSTVFRVNPKSKNNETIFIATPRRH